MSFHAKEFAGSHCGCRYQQDYRPTLGRDGKKESGTLEVIKFYYDGAIRFEQHCYGEAATFVFGVWADHMDPDGTLHWVLPDKNALWLVYCRTGRRSADAVQKLEALGYTDLRDLGGILSWPYEIEGDFEGHF